MGTLGNGLPDLPPEWGQVVIPDDLAQLDSEAREVRAQLERQARHRRRSQRRARWRRRLHLPEHVDDPENPSLFMPLLVVGLAVLIAMLSLFMMIWPNLMRPQPTRIDQGPSVIESGTSGTRAVEPTPETVPSGPVIR